MSANIPYLISQLKTRKRVLIRAKSIEKEMENNLRNDLRFCVYEVLGAEAEMNRLKQVRFR